jgi:hypothetical protein
MENFIVSNYLGTFITSELTLLLIISGVGDGIEPWISSTLEESPLTTHTDKNSV